VPGAPISKVILPELPPFLVPAEPVAEPPAPEVKEKEEPAPPVYV
jgi:hypothetical protein